MHAKHQLKSRVAIPSQTCALTVLCRSFAYSPSLLAQCCYRALPRLNTNRMSNILPLPRLSPSEKNFNKQYGPGVEGDPFAFFMMPHILGQMYDQVVRVGPDCQGGQYFTLVLNMNHGEVCENIYTYVGPETPYKLLGSNKAFLNEKKKRAMFLELFNYKIRYTLEKSMLTPLQHKIAFCHYQWGFINYRDREISDGAKVMIQILPTLMEMRKMIEARRAMLLRR